MQKKLINFMLILLGILVMPCAVNAANTCSYSGTDTSCTYDLGDFGVYTIIPKTTNGVMTYCVLNGAPNGNGGSPLTTSGVKMNQVQGREVLFGGGQERYECNFGNYKAGKQKECKKAISDYGSNNIMFLSNQKSFANVKSKGCPTLSFFIKDYFPEEGGVYYQISIVNNQEFDNISDGAGFRKKDIKATFVKSDDVIKIPFQFENSSNFDPSTIITEMSYLKKTKTLTVSFGKLNNPIDVKMDAVNPSFGFVLNGKGSYQMPAVKDRIYIENPMLSFDFYGNVVSWLDNYKEGSGYLAIQSMGVMSSSDWRFTILSNNDIRKFAKEKFGYDEQDATKLEDKYNDDFGYDKDANVEYEELVFCEQEGVLKTLNILGWLLYFLKIAVPGVLIVMCVIDFATAVTKSDEKALTTAMTTSTRRAIAAVAIFLVPSITYVAINLIGNSVSDDDSFKACNECLLKPSKCNVSTINYKESENSSSGKKSKYQECVDNSCIYIPDEQQRESCKKQCKANNPE